MNKLEFAKNQMKEETISEILDQILANETAHQFIKSEQLSLDEVRKDLLNFLLFIEDEEICKNCNSLEECKKSNKGIRNELIIDYYNQVACHSIPCKFYARYIYLNQLYVWRDFPDDLLNKKIKKSDIYPERNELLNQLGTLKNNTATKGVYVYGKSGVGKTYILICWCNLMVDKGHNVAFVNFKSFCNEMRELLFNYKNDYKMPDSVYKYKDEYDDNIKKLMEVEILVLDDLGNENISEWSRDTLLFDILDYRRKNNKYRTLITSNYDISELKKVYNIGNEMRVKRFIDLIKNLCEIIELDGLNHR